MGKVILWAWIICIAGFSQSPPPTPSEAALQKPFVMDDTKPTANQAPPKAPSSWQAVGPTLLVVLLAGGGLWAFRKYGAKALTGSKTNNLSVEESLSLGDRRFISILRADGERFLLALSPQSIHLLARLENVENAPNAENTEARSEARAANDNRRQQPFEKALEAQVGNLTPVKLKEMEARMRCEP